MPILTVPRLRPNALFTDAEGNLTLEGYRFLDGLYLRIGGSLDSLNAVTLADKTWDAPAAIGSTTPASGKFTSLQATSGFGCNGKTPQTSVDTAPVATTGATNTTPYGFTTAAQADDIITKLNTIITALIANGIMV